MGLNDVDPDPIWICEEITVCPVNPNAAANVTSFTVQPVHGKRQDTFTFDLTYLVTNDPEGMGLGDSVVVDSQAPGSYSMSFSMQASPSESEAFPNGVYMAEVAICEGSCGSEHSNSFLLSLGAANFTIRG